MDFFFPNFLLNYKIISPIFVATLSHFIPNQTIKYPTVEELSYLLEVKVKASFLFP